MSNLGSANATGFWNQKFRKQDQARQDRITKLSPQQRAFDTGTMNMLDEARNVVENAVGQGQEINPLIYQMLGLDPQYTDHSGELQDAQGKVDAAQKQYDDASQTLDTLKAIPVGRRSDAQRKQLAQLKGAQGIGILSKTLGDAKDAFGRLQTMPKQITGLTRLDPSKIPAESPFSAANPLHQAQATESQRLNDYLSGKQEVDPTLSHQYDAAEASLRATLTQRFGPDYEGTSVGQAALQTFTRQKNEAFATWNQQQVDKYNNLAFSGQANLQALLGNQIGLMREPSTTAMNEGVTLANTAGGRLTQQQTQQSYQLGRAGLQATPVMPSPIAGMAAGGLGSLLTAAGPAIKSGFNSLSSLFSPSPTQNVSNTALDSQGLLPGDTTGNFADSGPPPVDASGAVE